MMVVHTYDYETRAYRGPLTLTIADCDPRDLGTVLVPGNATHVPPPRCGVGLWPFWFDGRWVVMEEVEIPDPFEQFHCE